MNLLKSRTFIGTVCIALSLLICFAVTPLFNRAISEKTRIVRVVKEIREGEEIRSDMVKEMEVGGYNLPEDVIRNLDTAVGKFASADLLPGDYILASKLAKEPAAENAYLYYLNGEKQAISVSVKSFASGLSGKLQSGDIVSVIAPDYKKRGMTVIPQELQYVEIIAVTAGSGADANTGEEAKEDAERELPDTVTLLATPEQSKILAELEADGAIHLSLVYRGEQKNADVFIKAQEAVLLELYPPVTGENSDTAENSETAEESEIEDKAGAEFGADIGAEDVSETETAENTEEGAGEEEESGVE